MKGVLIGLGLLAIGAVLALVGRWLWNKRRYDAAGINRKAAKQIRKDAKVLAKNQRKAAKLKAERFKERVKRWLDPKEPL
jgi:hypothetical protein